MVLVELPPSVGFTGIDVELLRPHSVMMLVFRKICATIAKFLDS